MKKKITAVLSGYFIICFVWAVICAGLISVDCAHKLSKGEYTVLPEFNVAQYKIGGTLEERRENSDEAFDYWLGLYDSNGRIDNWSTYLLSIGISIGLCNLLIYYLSTLCGVHMNKKISVLFYGASVIFFMIILFIRTIMWNSYGETWLAEIYPFVFITWRELFIPVLCLAILTMVIKLSISDMRTE